MIDKNNITGKYILDKDRNPVEEPDLFKWGTWVEENKESCRLAKTEFGKVNVSTVFLLLDHAFGRGKPVLWETMVFENGFTTQKMEILGGKEFTFHKSLDDYSNRYHTKEEALKGHASIVSQLQAVGHKLKTK